jgi:hypothetical protein
MGANALFTHWTAVWGCLFLVSLQRACVASLPIVVRVVWAWTAVNAAIALGSMALSWATHGQHWDVWPAALRKSSAGRRPTAARLLLFPMHFVHTLFMWGTSWTAFRDEAVSACIPGTNIWIGSLPKWAALGSARPAVASVVVDCTTETEVSEDVVRGRVGHVVSLPCLDNHLPSAAAIAAACTTVLSLGHKQDPVLVGCMFGHSRSAAVACVLATLMFPSRYPCWRDALSEVAQVRPRVFVSSEHGAVLDAAVNAIQPRGGVAASATLPTPVPAS